MEKYNQLDIYLGLIEKEMTEEEKTYYRENITTKQLIPLIQQTFRLGGANKKSRKIYFEKNYEYLLNTISLKYKISQKELFLTMKDTKDFIIRIIEVI